MNSQCKIELNGLPGNTYDLEPGQARCPGVNLQSIIATDAKPAPEILRHEHYQFLGSDDIEFSRYYDPTFFAQELTHVWGRAWQWACRLEHIPQVGDYYVYEVGNYSALIVNTPKGIKAYHNSCLHRGTKLKPTEGVGSSQELRCPFHGWTWNLEGEIQRVPCAWDFPHAKPEDFKLPQIKHGLWGGFVFINFDEHAEPLEEYLKEVIEHFAGWDIENRYTELHVSKTLPCNWKSASEAFIEAYHVMETHPQLLNGTGDANVQYDVYGDHMNRFHVAVGVNSPHLEKPLTEQELFDQMLVGDSSVLENLTVKEGETARVVMARFLRQALGDKYGVDLANTSDSEIIDTIEYHIFPNMVLFPGVSLPMVYRFRPLGLNPDKSVFEILFLRPFAVGSERPEAPEIATIGEDESYAVAPGMDPHMAHVFDQDTSNMRAQQQGFKVAKKAGQTLGNYQEVRIRHFHRTIDKYLEKN